MDTPHTIVFLIYPGFQLLDLTGPLAMFSAANRAAGRRLYDIRVAAPQAGNVASSSGLAVNAGDSAAAAAARLGPGSTAIVAGGEEPGVRAALDEADVQAFIDTAFDRAGRVASVCSGTFLLARRGHLDGCRVTTHYFLHILEGNRIGTSFSVIL